MPRQAKPPKEKAHQANSAYTTLEDDCGDARQQPVPEGTWEPDRDAPGGWRFYPGVIRQVVQAEPTETDPHAQAAVGPTWPSHISTLVLSTLSLRTVLLVL